MSTIKKLDNLKVPSEHLPELLEFAGKYPEMLTKEVEAPGNAIEYSVAETRSKNSTNEETQIAFLGSSVTFGAGALGESFVDYLVKKDNIYAFKEAVSGTTLSDFNDDSYVARLKKLPVLENISLFVLQLSTNDIKLKDKKIGQISENDKYDITTVAGAIEYILDYVKKTWNCPVLIYSNPKFDSDFYQQMVLLTKKLQEKWHFEFLNLWDDPNFNYSDDQRKLYMLDDIHPTRAGYKLSWTSAFEEKIGQILAK